MGNTPNIRFKGFTDDWEQRKFGSLLKEIREKTKIENEDTLLSCAIDGMYLNSELFSHFRGSSNIGYLKVKKNDLILSAQNLHLGNCNVNLRFEHGIISPAYKVYELVTCDPFFIQAWVKQDSTKDFFLNASTEGASVCRKNIVWDELYKQTLPIPKLKEQEQIGQYFNELDNLITLHQRKLFLNFAKRNDWEQRKFGSLLKEIREKTKIENEDTLLSCAIDGMYLNSELFSHFRGSSNIGYLKVKKNDLILSAQNLHLGNCNVNLRFEHGIISPAYKVYELVTCDPFFIQAWVKQDSTKDFFLNASTEGASVCRKNIVWDELYKQTLPIPKLKEQEQIGQYFNELDNLITLHRRAYYNKKGGLTNVHNDNQQHYAIL